MAGIAGLMTADGSAPGATRREALADALGQQAPAGVVAGAFGGVALVEARDRDGNEPGATVFANEGAAVVRDGSIYRQDTGERQGRAELLLRHRHEAGSFAVGLGGAFVAAIYDQAEAGLTLARDPFGAKTLYYSESSEGLAFASRPRVLIEAGFADRDILDDPRDEILQMQFATGRETIYRGIHRVLPGETLGVASGRIVSRARQAALPPGGPENWDEAEALSRLDAAIGQSLEAHLSDTETFAVFLSGGIDSSVLLAALAARDQLPRRVFTAYLTGIGAGETAPVLASARRQATKLGIEQIEIAYGEDEFWRLLPEIVELLDDPVADPTVLPIYLLAREAGPSESPVLLGDGGDELFAGYGRYRSVVRPWYLGGPKVIHPRGRFDRLDILRRQPAAWRDGIRAAESLENQTSRSKLQVAQAVDCADWLPNDVLLRLERCLGRHGLDGRFPFLDAAVAEVAFALADDLKVKGGHGKYLLRRWLEKVVPEAEPFAPKQRGPSPIMAWMSHHGERLGPLVAAEPGVAEVARPDRVVALFRKEGRREAFAAWSLLFYALWHRRHVLDLEAQGDVFETLASGA